MDEPIPAVVRDFIARQIHSVAQLEALLLLRNSPGEPWDAAAAARRLYTTESDIAGELQRLCEDGLLICSEGIYRYDLPAEQRAVVDALAEIYSRHLIPVTNLIHSKPRRIHQFADAFKFRKDR